MAPAWPSSVRAMSWASDIQGVEAPSPVTTAHKYTQQIHREPEDTNKWRNKSAGKADSQVIGGHGEPKKKPQDQQGLGYRSRTEVGGAGVRATGEGSQR